MSDSKKCTSCGVNKLLTEFYRNKNFADGLSYKCKLCSKAYGQDPVNKDHANQLRREKYAKDPTKVKASNKRNHINHREQHNENARVYYANHVEQFSAYNKQYRKDNADSITLRNQRRRHSLQQFPIIQQNEINQLMENYNYQCFYCHIEVKRGINLHLDHKLPLSRGGSHTIDNLVPACQTCNLKKGTKTVEEFLIIKGNK
jgi:5-methylcytosine-specific restriction endonuclease McrA